jgi:hypothetical protein
VLCFAVGILSSLLCCDAYSTLSCSASLSPTRTQCKSIQFSTTPFYTVQFCIALFCNILYCTVLYYTIPHYTTLQCTAHYYTTQCNSPRLTSPLSLHCRVGVSVLCAVLESPLGIGCGLWIPEALRHIAQVLREQYRTEQSSAG